MKSQTFSHFIENIEDKIDSILKKKTLTPLITPSEFIFRTHGHQHRYYSVCMDKNGNKIFFHALLNKDDESRHKFLNELFFANVIKSMSSGLAKYMPQYIDASEDQAPVPWLISTYIEDKVLEDKQKAEHVYRTLNLEEIFSITHSIYQINTEFLKIYDLKTIDRKSVNIVWNVLDTSLPIIVNRGLVQENIAIKIKEFVHSNFNLLTEENIYFTHGDFHLGNIIVNDKHKSHTIIIDWENYHINNFAYDIAFLYSRLFDEKSLRKQLVLDFIKKIPDNSMVKKFYILFRCNLIYFALTYGLTSEPTEFDQETIMKRKSFFSNSMTTALDEFDALLSI